MSIFLVLMSAYKAEKASAEKALQSIAHLVLSTVEFAVV